MFGPDKVYKDYTIAEVLKIVSNTQFIKFMRLHHWFASYTVSYDDIPMIGVVFNQGDMLLSGSDGEFDEPLIELSAHFIIDFDNEVVSDYLSFSFYSSCMFIPELSNLLSKIPDAGGTQFAAR